MKVHGLMKRRQRELSFFTKTAQADILVNSHLPVKKSADLSSKRSAFLMRPRLMERSEHKSAAELILDIKDVKDLTPKIKGVKK